MNGRDTSMALLRLAALPHGDTAQQRAACDKAPSVLLDPLVFSPDESDGGVAALDDWLEPRAMARPFSLPWERDGSTLATATTARWTEP